MEAALEWLKANAANIAAVWGALVALCTVVVKLTPTSKDDNILAWVVKVADWFSVVNPNKPKDK